MSCPLLVTRASSNEHTTTLTRKRRRTRRASVAWHASGASSCSKPPVPRLRCRTRWCRGDCRLPPANGACVVRAAARCAWASPRCRPSPSPTAAVTRATRWRSPGGRWLRLGLSTLWLQAPTKQPPLQPAVHPTPRGRFVAATTTPPPRGRSIWSSVYPSWAAFRHRLRLLLLLHRRRPALASAAAHPIAAAASQPRRFPRP